MTDEPFPETYEDVYGYEEFEETPPEVKPEVMPAEPPPLEPGTAKLAAYVKEKKAEAEAVERAKIASRLEGTLFSDLAAPMPEEENPDALLANNFMRKGHAVFLSAPSGVGKSVISIQLAYAWACGKEAFGIRPVRPLRIGIIESEDDSVEMYTFRESMRRGYKAAGWTDEDLAKAEGNIRWIQEFAAGEDFVNLIANIQTTMYEKGKVDGVTKPFDLFIVNPFLNYIGVDATNNDDLKAILRNLLDPVIKSEGPYKDKPWTKCGLFFIHHFTKPPSAQARGSFGIDDYAHYASLGGSDLTNWQRASLTIAPIMNKELKKEGYAYYWLAAPKRGKWLKWPKSPIKEAPSIPARLVRQANWKKEDEKELLFWFDMPLGEGPNKTDAIGEDTPTVEQDAELVAGQVKMRPYSATDLRKRCQELWTNSRGKNDTARGNRAYDHFAEHCADYGCVMKPGANNSKTFYAA